MSTRDRVEHCLKEMRHHLYEELLPFWTVRGVDQEYGGFLTYLDEKGEPTGESVKTLICQTRMIYSYSSAYRAIPNVVGQRWLDIAKQGVDFLFNHFWDEDHPGWFWTTERDGTPRDRSKIMYGHSFAIYALSEYTMASGDPRGLEMAIETWKIIKAQAVDVRNGGFMEFFEEDWSPKQPGVYGGDRKSLDVHMHLMEAFTNLYEATGNIKHKQDLLGVIDLLCSRMLHPQYRTGIAQFAFDWTPLRAILFKNVWGADRDVDDQEGRPLDNTSFGHNVEFCWLLNHAINILGIDRKPFEDTMRKIFDHAAKYGIDWKNGGVYCEGPNEGPAREKNKEFWQQAEALIGFLDACLIFGTDNNYFDAYENLHRFVMDRVINHEVGEWYPLFDENNTLLWTYMAHAWKINYHTVRSAIQSEIRLTKLLQKLGE